MTYFIVSVLFAVGAVLAECAWEAYIYVDDSVYPHNNTHRARARKGATHGRF